jgi:hypothetical protein
MPPGGPKLPSCNFASKVDVGCKTVQARLMQLFPMVKCIFLLLLARNMERGTSCPQLQISTALSNEVLN